MRFLKSCKTVALLVSLTTLSTNATNATNAFTVGEYTLEPGHPSLQVWALPIPSHPADNKPSKDRIALGRALFFDPRLSGSGDMSCASCHNPNLGWADGLGTGVGANGRSLKRATPTILNSVYNHLQMWDGRFDSLEAQVMGPITNENEMDMQPERLLSILRNDSNISDAFARAYPGQGINIETLSKAIASFERTLISTDSPFDQWVLGDRTAMSESQIRGFEVFLNPDKGNCVVCHAPPNFSDDGYHNIGLDLDQENPDYGRFERVPVAVLKGAFKTPTLRDIKATAPYFHNGAARTLSDVLDHYANYADYASVDNNPTNISPALNRTQMTKLEQDALLDFMDALTGKQPADTSQ